MGLYTRFHIYVGKGTKRRRTTISVENYLAECLAIRLGEEPRSEDAHSAIRKFLQEAQDDHGKEGKLKTHILKWIIMDAVVDPLIKRLL